MRRTIVVHTKLAGHMARVDAARAGAHGIQILTMGQMAARLAGGFLAPIDSDCLRDAVRDLQGVGDRRSHDNLCRPRDRNVDLSASRERGLSMSTIAAQKSEKP
jgi:hypothetical protein